MSNLSVQLDFCGRLVEKKFPLQSFADLVIGHYFMLQNNDQIYKKEGRCTVRRFGEKDILKFRKKIEVIDLGEDLIFDGSIPLCIEQVNAGKKDNK